MKLYGFPMSNYYNMVKIALLEKGIAFEEVTTMPNQEPDFLAKSPMGKVPCLETSNGLLTESSAILEYIEEWEDGTALLPTDREERAKVRSMCRTMELYIELSARRLYPQVFFGEFQRVNQRLRGQMRTGLTGGHVLAQSLLMDGKECHYTNQWNQICSDPSPKEERCQTQLEKASNTTKHI